MKRCVLGTALASLLFTGAVRAQVPDTPAGHQFAAWLDAFNSGDGERIRKFLVTTIPRPPEIERNSANRLDPRFRLRSMNKMFSAVSILQLVQAGKIKLSDPLGTYVPDYPNREIASKVTSLAQGRIHAYGFEDVRARDGSGSVGHGGGAPGMNGELRIYPKSGYVVAVLSNLDPPTATQLSAYLDVRLAR